MRPLPLLFCVPLVILAREAAATTAADIPCTAPAPPGTCVVTASVTVTPGSTLDFTTRSLVVAPTGSLDAGGGNMVIKAASVELQPGAQIASRGALALEIDTTGAIQIEGTSAGTAGVDVSGIGGGTLTLKAGGDVTISGRVLADATSTRGDGGSIEVDGAQVTISPTGKVSATGGQGGGTGGDITITGTQTDVSISGSVDASGSDGGLITVDGHRDVTTMPTAALDARSGAGGSGNEIDILADTGSVSLAGAINVAASGSLAQGGGSAGGVNVDAVGTLTLAATINASGGGPGGAGGSVSFRTDGDIDARSAIDASAPGQQGVAGDVSFTSNRGMVQLAGDVAATGDAGTVTASAATTISASGQLTTDGTNGTNDLSACTVNVLAAAHLSSLGSGGKNHIAASGQMTVAGTLSAGATNLIEFRDPLTRPVLSGSFSPPPTVMQNASLPACSGVPSTTTTTLASTTTTTTTTRPPSTTTTTRPASTSTSTSTTRPAPTTSTSTTVPTTSTTSRSTTTATATSTTSTTCGRTTTTTAPSSTSTTATRSTTTTSRRPTTTTNPAALCTPSNCDDRDPCTEDQCDPRVGCVHRPATGVDAVSCRLEAIDGILSAATPDELGGVDSQVALQRRIARTLRLVEKARTAHGRLARDNPRRARLLLQHFVHLIQNGEARGRIPFDVGDPLVMLGTEALSALLGLTPP